MYIFKDKGDRSVILKLEGILLVVRLFVESRLFNEV